MLFGAFTAIRWPVELGDPLDLGARQGVDDLRALVHDRALGDDLQRLVLFATSSMYET